MINILNLAKMLVALICTFPLNSINSYIDFNELPAYTKRLLTKLLHNVINVKLSIYLKFLLIIPNMLFGFLISSFMCSLKIKLLCIITPKSLM